MLINMVKFMKKIVETLQVSQENFSLKSIIKQIKQEAAENKCDNLEQYNRLKNLELHGTPITKKENTNQVVKKIVRLIKQFKDFNPTGISKIKQFLNAIKRYYPWTPSNHMASPFLR